VPGTQVIFDDFVGELGFYRACQFAVEGELPKVILKEGKPAVERSLEEAILASKKIITEKEEK